MKITPIKLECPLEGCNEVFDIPLHCSSSVVKADNGLTGVNMHFQVGEGGMTDIVTHVNEHIEAVSDEKN